MSNPKPKVLLFGSFTEGEISSRFPYPSSDKDEKPIEKKKLLFGSFDFEATKQLGSVNGIIGLEPKKSLTKEVKVNGAILKNDRFPEKLGTVRANGHVDICTNSSLSVTKVEKYDSTSLSSSQKENSELNQTCSSKFRILDGESTKNFLNGTCDSTISVAKGTSPSKFHIIDGESTKDNNLNGTCDSTVSVAKGTSPSKFHILDSESTKDNNLNGKCDSAVSVAKGTSPSKFHILDGESTKDNNLNGTCDSTISVAKCTSKADNGTNGHLRNLLPRGLINSGNLCFLNATLQALLSCTPFAQLLQEVRTRNLPKVGYPTLSTFSEFIADFDAPNDSSLTKKYMATLESGKPFRPTMFEGVLRTFTPDVSNNISGRPRQEDAQEFLSYIMDQMHDELLKLDGQSALPWGSKSSLVSSVDNDEWETVGRKNKSAVTRTQTFFPSELSEIFGGQLRSEVTARGSRASATVQPYLLLHLDIYPEVVRTIEDALHLFAAPEILEGYRTSVPGKAGFVAARKSVKIQKLSKIMILHLMRFSYGSHGSKKLHKSVRFPLELMLSRELLFSPSTEGRKYELVATITHHGREPSKGHYTADARYPNDRWLRFDDSSVSAVDASKVLHEHPYVLFYKQV